MKTFIFGKIATICEGENEYIVNVHEYKNNRKTVYYSAKFPNFQKSFEYCWLLMKLEN